jgi:arginine N-succinyltransferase
MMIVRPAHLDDLPAVMDLAARAGPGFTSLSLGENQLAGRLENSLASFATGVVKPDGEMYFLVVEDRATRQVVGIAGISAQVGVKVPFYSYRRTTLAQCSSAVGRRFDMDALYPVNESAGATEVGTLFVVPEVRGTGSGRLVAKSRYLLMAIAPQRFGEKVVAELRGVVDAEGHSPFWEALGRPFFRMDFEEADRISATDNQFISDLLPTHPIYLDLLPAAARAVVGVAHPEGRTARRLLEAEGFRHRGLVDVFDAGPVLTARRERLKTIRNSRSLVVRVGPPNPAEQVSALVATERLPDFRVCAARVAINDEEVTVGDEIGRQLALEPGERARVWTAP